MPCGAEAPCLASPQPWDSRTVNPIPTWREGPGPDQLRGEQVAYPEWLQKRHSLQLLEVRPT